MTTPTSVTIRRATEDDAVNLLPVFVDAFLDGPVADWLIPDREVRRLVYFRYFRLMLRLGLKHGWIDTTDDLTAAAIWYRRDHSASHKPPLGYADDLAYATGRYAPKFELLDMVFEAHHPRMPHDYLAYLAVDPAHQRRSIGTALLTHAHAALDEQHRGAYLEASNVDNQRLYRRLGWETSEPLRVSVDGPQIWRMWRSPRTGADIRSPFGHNPEQ